MNNRTIRQFINLFISSLVTLMAYANSFAASIESDPSRANLEVERAYDVGENEKIVVLKSQAANGKTPNPQFIGNNLTFYCKENRCDQMLGESKSYANSNKVSTFKGADGSSGTIFDSISEGKLTITCDQGATPKVGRVAEEQKLLIQEKLRNGDYTVHSLVLERQVKFVFKMGPEYIYVDEAKLDPGARTFRFFKGRKGQMKESKIYFADMLMDGGTYIIQLTDNTALNVPPKAFKKRLPVFGNNESAKKLEYVEAEKEIQRIKPKEDVFAGPLPAGPCSSPQSPTNKNNRINSRDKSATK